MRMVLRTLVSGVAFATLLALAPAQSASSIAGVRPAPPPTLQLSGQAAPRPAEAPAGPVAVMLRLEGAPVTASRDEAGTATRIRAQQEALSTELQALGVPELYRVRMSYNGIAVLADASQLEHLASLPGVAGVTPLVAKHRTAGEALRLIGAPEAWARPPGLTGRGIRIAVVDSGIDYIHANFGGPGTPAAYALNASPAVVEPGTFPTPRVDGTDLAGDGYDADGLLGSSIPVPDPDPFDCRGHGTSVASIAAGSGVAASGQTYRGPYDASIDLASLRIPPGVAPEARLLVYKVFGCTGTTILTAAAIDLALDPNGDGRSDDRVDVLNLALGSPFGSADDPDALAAEQAARAGVVVVAPAGNTGNTFFAVHSPGVATSVISVASSFDDRASFAGLADTIQGRSARGPRRGDGLSKPDITAPGAEITTALAGSGTLATVLDGTSAAAPHVAGAAALLRQLHADWQPYQVKAALMNSAVPIETTGGELVPPTLAGAGRLDIPRALDTTLLAYSSDLPGLVSLSYGLQVLATPQTLSRGLTIENRGSVPRSVTLTSLVAASEAGVTVQPERTSLEVPPGGTVTVPVAAVVDPALLSGDLDAATPVLTPSGFPRAGLAEHSGLIALEASVPAGNVQLRVRNGTAGEQSVFADKYPVAVKLAPGATSGYVSLLPGTYRLWSITPAGVGLQLYASLEAGVRYTLELSGPAATPHGVLIRDGAAGGGERTTLHVPFQLTPRAAAEARVAGYSDDSGAAPPRIRVQIANSGARNEPSGVRAPVVSAYELVYQNDAAGGPASLEVIGVTSNYVGNLAETTLFFGMATREAWSTPNAIEVTISIDLDGDGRADRQLVTASAGALLGGPSDDAHYVMLYTRRGTRFVASGIAVPLYGLTPPPTGAVDTAPFATRVLTVAFGAAELGLTPGQTSFTYQVSTRVRTARGFVPADEVGPLRYDVAAPRLQVLNTEPGSWLVSLWPYFSARDGSSITVFPGGGTGPGPARLLLLYHHNPTAQQVEVLALSSTILPASTLPTEPTIQVLLAPLFAP